MNSQKNVKYLFIGKDINRVIAGGALIDNYADLVDGEIVFATPSNYVVDLGGALDNANYDKLKVIQRSGTNLLFSPVIDVRNITSYKAKAYSGPNQQVDYIGYNGTSGSIEVINSNLYQVIINMKEDGTVGNSINQIKRGVYKSATAATQSAIAAGLCESLVNNFSREANRPIKFERVYSGALSDAIGVLTADVAYGSTAVKFSGDATGIVLVGSILRIGGTGAGTAPCYVVKSTDGGAGAARIYNLDIPYQGASATIAHGSIETAAAGGNWGIKLTGIARPATGTFSGKKDEYSIVRWVLGGDLGTTTIGTATAATPGTGVWKQIADLEFFCQGNEGNLYRGDMMHTDRSEVVVDETYDVIALNFYDNSDTGGLNDAKSPIEVLIARGIGAGDQHSNALTGYVTVLDDWAVTNFAVPGLTVQIGNFT
jgi:hypothetical protein